MHVVAVSARPGDVEFAVGGTLARFVNQGDTVTIVTIANGNSTTSDMPPRELAAIAQSESVLASQQLGVDLIWMNHSDFAVSSDAVTRLKMVEILRSANTDLVLGPTPLSNQIDVGATWDLLRAAIEMASVPNVQSNSEALLSRPVLVAYEHAWSVGFVPTEFVDVTRVFTSKIKTLNEHRLLSSRLKKEQSFDLAEAARTVGMYRGLQAGVGFAEAFYIDPCDGTALTHRLLP